MPRTPSQLENQLKDVFNKAQIVATAKTFDPSVVNESDTMEVVMQKISDATASAFAEALAGPLAKILHDYQSKMEFIITGLVAPTGPCTGIIKVKP